MSNEYQGGYTRRQELTCTEAQIATYADIVLHLNEKIYVRMNSGVIRMKLGDGVTGLCDLPYTKIYDGTLEDVEAMLNTRLEDISGVFVSPEEPTNPDVSVWIDPDEEGGENFLTESDIAQGLGDRPDMVLSQKAVTRGIGEAVRIFSTIRTGAISAEDGSVVENGACRYATIDLVNDKCENLRFKTSAFDSNYGYGFVLADGTWQGTKTTATEEVNIAVPENAVTFKLCWTINHYTDNPITGIKSKVVNLDNASFVEKELYPKVHIGAISAEDGTVAENNAVRYITVNLEEYRCKKLRFKTSAFSLDYGYGFVLADGTWQGVKTTATEEINITVPENAVTFKLCWTPVLVEKNNIYGVISSASIAEKQIEEITETLLCESDIEFTTFVGAISAEDGTIVENTTCRYTVIDGVNKYKKIRFITNPFGLNYGYGFALSDGTWKGFHPTQPEITKATEILLDVPENAVNFKTCWSINYFNENKIRVSSIMTSEMVDKKIQEEKAKGRCIVEITPDYDLSVVPQISAITMPTTVDGVYALYDNLMSSNPNWITKEDCSSADELLNITRPSYLNGLPIYLYKFAPKRVATTADNSNRLKVLIVCGTHPNEKMGIFTVHKMFEMINSLWKTNATMAQFRTMVDFYVFPCISPWGYNNNSRVNGNGVNLNRNFPTKDWALSGSGTNDYSGASAGSEYETQIVMHYMREIKPDAVFDAHTGGMTATGRYGCVDVDYHASENIIGMCLSMSRAMSNCWIAENNNFPQDADTPIFDTNLQNITGLLHRWSFENITKLSILTEQSVENRWKEGVLLSTAQETYTDRVWRENLQSVYNTVLRLVHAASIGLN